MMKEKKEKDGGEESKRLGKKDKVKKTKKREREKEK